MSESSLNIRIGASNSEANAAIKSVEANIAALQGAIQRLGGTAETVNAKMAAGFRAEIAAQHELIGAIEAASARGIAAAEKAAAAEFAAREKSVRQSITLNNTRANAEVAAQEASVRQSIALNNMRANAERDAAMAVSRYEAEQQAVVLAQREASIRQAMALNNARVNAERDAEDRATAAAERTAAAQIAAAQKARGETDVTHRTLSQGVAAGAGVGAERQISSASASARVLETSLSAAAYADDQRRIAEAEATAELKKQEQVLGKIAEQLSEIAEAEAAFKEQAIEAALALKKQQEEFAASAASQRGGGFMSKLFSPQMAKHEVAEFDSIVSGRHGQAIATLSAAARDAGLGVGALAASMGGLIAIMGTAAILRSAEEMGKWATEIRAGANATGMSVEQYSALQTVFTGVGLKADEADETLRHLASTLSDALTDKTSKQAEAFHNLGITQDRLIANGPDVMGALHLIADALTRTENSTNRATNLNELFGKSYEKILPAIQDGSGALDGWMAKAKENGEITEAQAKTLEDLGRTVEELTKSIRTGAIQAFADWAPAIKAVVEVLGELLSLAATGLHTIAALGTAIGNAIADAATGTSAAHAQMKTIIPAAGKSGLIIPPATTTLATSVIPSVAGAAGGARTSVLPGVGTTGAATVLPQVAAGPKAPVPPLTPPISQDAQRNLEMATAEATASKGATNAHAAHIAEIRAGITVLEKFIATDVDGSKQMVDDKTKLANAQKELNNALIPTGGAAAARKQARETYELFVEGEKKKIAEAQGSSQKILAIYDEWIAGVKGKYASLVGDATKQATEIVRIEREKVQAINTARLGEIRDTMKTTEDQNQISRLNSELAALKGGTAFTATKQLGPTGEQQIQQKAQQDAAQVEAAAQIAIAKLQQTADAAIEGSTTQKGAQEDITNLVKSSKQEEIELYKKAAEAGTAAAEKIAAPFLKLFDSIGSQFENLAGSIIQSVIAPQVVLIKAGLTTIKENMRSSEIANAVRTMFVDAVKSAGSAIMSAVGNAFANAISKGAANTIGELLQQTFTKLIGNITGQAAGSAIGSAAGSAAATTAPIVTAVGTGATATAAAITTAATGETTGIVTAITTMSTAVVGAITSTAAITDSLLTSISVKPSFLGTTYASGGIVSAQGGMVTGGMGTQLAILHANEMVLPEPISRGVQQMVGRGNANTANLNYSPTINAPRGRGGTGMSRSEFSAMMGMHGGAMMGEARNLMRSGWRPA